MRAPRWTEITESPYPWERQALDYLRSRLPDTEPFHAWSNFEFIGADGSINEVDLLVISTHRIYLVEIKSRPGRVTGDAGTWTWHRDGKPIADDNPLLLANRKAKKLKSLLQDQMGRRRRELPYIDAVVFLSNETVRCELDPSGRTNVFLDEQAAKRDGHPDIVTVLTGGTDASAPGRGARPIDSALGKAIARAVDSAGIRTSQSQRRVGDYRLEELLLETDLYQDWKASHVSLDGLTRRVRIYPIAPQATAETREVQRRAAEREFQVLNHIEHPGILGAEQFTEHERGPALVFRHDPEAERLDLFLERKGDALGIDVRLALLRQIAEAVAHAHAKKLYHRVLSPQTILVTAPNAAVPHVKVFDWQMAREGVATEHGTTTAVAQTLHVDLAGDRQSLLYAAPEMIGGRGFDGEKLDVFSLGAIAFHLFTGRPPAVSVEELHAKLSGGRGLKVSDALDGVLDSIQELVELTTDPSVDDRPGSVGVFLSLLDDVEQEYTAPSQEDEGVHPLEAHKGDRLEGGFTVSKRLGKGSTSVALLVRRDDGREGVLKVAASPEQNARLTREGEVLESIRHANVVELYDTCEIRGHVALFMAMAGAESVSGTYTLAQRLRDDGPLSLDLLQRFGEDLLIVVEWLERQGISHRDIKPENIGVASAGNKGALTLVLFDFSLVDVPAENVRAGTPPYLDPFLRLRKRPRWDVYAERFAAAMTLHEMATRQLPGWGDGRSEPSVIEDEVTLDSELFDPDVRDGLTRFFRKALARDHTARFDNAEEMRRAWFRVFEGIDEPSGTGLTTTGHDEPPDYAALLAEATRATPLSQLGLSPRMLNALERMGAHTVGQLTDLHKMRLYRNKGIGQKTVREIRNLALAVPATLRKEATLDPAMVADQEGGDDSQMSWSVDRVAAALIGPRLADEERTVLGALFGLGDDASPPAFAPTRAVADVLGQPWAAVQRVVLAARERWLRARWMTALRDDVATLVERHAGVMTADELADAVLAKRGSELENEARRPPGLAVARAAIETESARDGARFTLFRDAERVFVVATGAADGVAEVSVEARARYAASLGERCDELANDPSLLAPTRVLEELAKVPIPAGDAPMPPERMLRLGVRASRHAALSSRMEIYPRGMKAVRALRLGAGSLLGPKSLAPGDIENRIRSRYPEAEPLPDRHPALERLLEEAEVPLSWDAASSRFTKKTRHAGLWSATGASTLHRHGTSTVAPRTTSPDVTDARALETRIATAVQERGFLVLGVAPKRFAAAAAELESRFELERISVEALLVAELKAQAAKHGVVWDVALRADAAEPESRDWRNLLRLVGWAMPAVEERLLAPGRPRLLVHAGLLARYGKMDTLDRLRDLCERDRGAPGYVLLLPMDGQTTAPLVDGEHLPLVLTSQWARVGEGWLANVHRGTPEPQPKESAVGR